MNASLQNRTLELNPIPPDPFRILCGSCPFSSGAAANSAASTRKHISNCQIPAWSPSCPEERPSTFCLKKSINIFDCNISFS